MDGWQHGLLIEGKQRGAGEWDRMQGVVCFWCRVWLRVSGRGYMGVEVEMVAVCTWEKMDTKPGL